MSTKRDWKLAGKVDTHDITTAVVISGGNVDLDLYAGIQREESG